MTLNPQDELLDRARKVIRDLREKLTAAEAQSQSEPIAVIGMGLQFPGCGTDPQAFWQMIVEGRDAVKSVPPDRWDRDVFYAPDTETPGKINTRQAAFLDEVRRFDAAFFDITPREAARMDPQQRIFLETAWHALEDAGLPKSRMSGSDTGVFVGVHSHSADYHAMQFENLATLDPYAATGTAQDMIAGRLAYWLDLHGPAIAVNTACSSSLTAVHLAARGLRTGDCTVAIVGGVNLLLTPASTAGMAQLQLLSTDGRCHTFDARASGMGRGEGCGVVVLKKLSAAINDGDRVQAIIRGSAINQDGKTNGLTAPNGLAQQRVVRRALEDAKIGPWEIGYVEAHGTGTALGDPIEVEALGEVLGGGDQRIAPCALGAVKANIGHLEGAAGIAALIKTVLVLQHRWIPPVANLEKLNPHLALHGTGLKIPQHGSAWNTAGRRLAGVSSFGWSGTNAHVVVEEAPAAKAPVTSSAEWPVVISAQSPDALRSLAAAFADRLEKAEDANLLDISYTSTMRRTHHAHRIAVKGARTSEVASRLRQRAAHTERAKSPAPTHSGNVARNLEDSIRAWEAGAEVNWQTFFPAPGNVADLPGYPFQGRSYWLELPEASATAAVTDSTPNDWLYATEWIDAPLENPQTGANIKPAGWILVHSQGQLTERLAETIRQRGDRVIKVPIATSEPVGLQQIFAGATQNGVSPQHAVFLVEGLSAAETIAAALNVAQAVLHSGLPLKLWFVTQEADPDPSQSVLCGFSRVFGLEHPDSGGGIIDADSSSDECAAAIYAEITQGSGEDRVALRHGRRLVARLRRDKLTERNDRLKLSADRSYLVTGAFGRIGMEIASWLVDRGARHLALVGRRDPSLMGKAELILQLDLWREQGITVLAEACDVSDDSQVRAMFAKIEASGNSLAGIIHAAGGLHFSPILDALQQDVESVLRAKVEGASNLDRATRETNLDFFVLFGSAAATIGLRNGALYAAANSSLDAIATERKALGLPALCVEWGLWEFKEEDKQGELVGQSGFLPMRPEKALRVLDALIASGRSTALVADIDWTVLGAALEMRGRHALATEMMTPTVSTRKASDITQEADWLQSLQVLSTSERGQNLLDFVAAEVRTVFGMGPGDPLDEERGLFQLGMDSLMSVRLKRRLETGTGLRLPGTLTLTYPTVIALAEYLEKKLFPISVAETAMPPLSPEEKFVSASITEMDDSETNAAIAAEIVAIQQKLGVL